MLVSHKAFQIYMGHAGEDTDFSHDEANDVQGFERTLVTSDVCNDAMVAAQPGWLARTTTSISERTRLPRTARG
jgi:hypothetical protein